ncbi:(2Fe-2S)-binding protein [Actibacterium lipolyticum]|uniref:Nicotinate dehydrogenase subunit A n=1 Tax=Actibacterium lipolyticum TaxID=1524263 RepID=A0A238KP61_9RHOB|nr:(2Fe-2S)-binding protein [Actibacterium lipolyticum]SMX44430.1 Nicotinate dehydrogenase subunit A [Actibacterium lipolyticum]
MTISFRVNGHPHEVDAKRGGDKLIDFLHEDLNLTGTKFCCGIGICRACTVSVKKGRNEAEEPVISCSTALATLDGTSITTVEGVSNGDQDLHPIQTEFLKNFAFQCGYCTPGFVMAAKILLDQLETSKVSKDQLDGMIEEAIGTHICRCTGYVRYFEAVRKTALDVLAAKEGGQG